MTSAGSSKNRWLSRTTVIALFAALGILSYLIAYLLHLPFNKVRWILISVLAVGGAGRDMSGPIKRAWH